MLNQYSKSEIEDFVWAKAGIHVKDSETTEEGRRCTMNGTHIEYQWGTSAYSLKEKVRANFANNLRYTAMKGAMSTP